MFATAHVARALCSFTQAGSEVSALLGRIPSAVGYQPTLATDMGTMQERITTTRKGSITSVQAIYVPADDLTDPAPATTFSHLDATTVLSRSIAELGIYPAVDPLDSSSRILDPNIVGSDHYDVARSVQKVLQVQYIILNYLRAQCSLCTVCARERSSTSEQIERNEQVACACVCRTTARCKTSSPFSAWTS